MRVAFVVLLSLCFVTAGPVHGAGKESKKKAGEAASLNATLADFQSMKNREKMLKVLIRRSKGSRQENYTEEFDMLRPRLYDAAQTMEKQVQDFERVYGRKSLCRVVKRELRPIVGVCPKH